MIGIEKATAKVWDVIVIGGGPAGMQAAIYAASEGLSTLIIERHKVGGQIGQTPLLENFIGYERGVSGAVLARSMQTQAVRMGAAILSGEVAGMYDHDCGVKLMLNGGWELKARSAVIATGSDWKHLDIPGVKEGIGTSILYGPDGCEWMDATDREIAIVGGGNSAGQAIVELAARARTVHVILRSKLKTSRYLTDRIEAARNVILYEHTDLTSVVCRRDAGCFLMIQCERGQQQIAAEKLLICGGLIPNTDWCEPSIKTNDDGFIVTGAAVGSSSPLGTSLAGVFAIGDCRAGVTKRVGAVIGDGSSVVTEIWRHFGACKSCLECSF